MGENEDKGRVDKLKQFETTARYHVHCEEKAFHIVNKLIEGQFDADYLIECSKLINREHYNDIVEERAITLLCGYPLCGHPLRDIPKKKYHISTKTNRVFDISERKNFCSNQCLKASKWLANQLPDSPVWAREREEPEPIQLLPHTQIRGMLGEEVVGMSPKRVLEDEMAELKLLDEKSPSDRKKQSTELKAKKRSDSRGTEAHSKERTTAKEVDIESKKPEKNSVENVSPLHLSDNAVGKEDGELCKDFKNLSVNAGGILETSAETNLCTDKLDKLAVNEGKVEESPSSLDGGIQACESKKSEDSDSVLSNCSLTTEGTTHTSPEKQESEISGTNSSENLNQSKNTEKCQTAALSQMEQLKLLMAKKKHVLSQMVDIQESSVKSSIQVKSTPQENELRETPGNKCAPAETVPETEKELAGHDASVATKSVASASTKKSNISAISPLRHLSKIINSWTTERTKLFLNAESTQEAGPATFSDPHVQHGYANICARLNQQQEELSEILDGSESKSDEKKRILKSAPAYKVLKEETDAYQKSVSEFITGKKIKEKVKGDEDDDKDEVCLPTVDAYNQMQIRAKIVLERLDKSVPELLVPLGLSIQDVSSLMRQLVYTFSLDKDSIVLKPMQWMLAAVLLLKMLSTRYQHIRAAFNTDTATRYFTVLLTGIGHIPADLDQAIEDILCKK